MSLKNDIVEALLTRGHWNHAANGKTVTCKLRDRSTTILTLAEAESEGIKWTDPKAPQEPKEEVEESAETEEHVGTKEDVEANPGEDLEEGDVEANPGEDLEEGDVELPEEPTDPNDLKKSELQEVLTELGVEYDPKAKVAELRALYSESVKQPEDNS